MMKTEFIENLIDNSDKNTLQKNILIGFVRRSAEAENNRTLDIELIQKISSCEKIQEVLLSTEDLKIYKVCGKRESDISHPFRSIFKKDDKWHNTFEVSPTLDTAFLAYLNSKYANNGDFSVYAVRMLDIK